MSHLPDAVFRTVIDAVPLVSIDLLVRRPDGCFLVGWRRNRPAADHWFVPGGRIRKNETLAEAFARLTEAELGAARPFPAAHFAGVFEHLYDDTVFGSGDSGTHYVVLAYQLEVEAGFTPRIDAQHERFIWLPAAELASHPQAHPYTQAYFASPAAGEGE